MNCNSLLIILVTSLISSQNVHSIPPDFFRLGRNGHSNSLKRASSTFTDDIVTLMCGYCAARNYISEASCFENLRGERKNCAIALSLDIGHALHDDSDCFKR